jgi:hypothetical protein
MADQAPSSHPRLTVFVFADVVNGTKLKQPENLGVYAYNGLVWKHGTSCPGQNDSTKTLLKYFVSKN